MRGVCAGLFIAVAMQSTFSAVAQSYPSPLLRVVVGAAAGGDTTGEFAAGDCRASITVVKTPKDIMSALHRATMTALGNTEIARRLEALEYVVVGDTPEEFMTFIRSGSDALATAVKVLNLKSEQD